MKISSISDVHVKLSSDDNFVLLKKFLTNKNVRNSDYVILNGDIFDILIGGKKKYFKKYKPFFEEILELVNSGVKVVYIEGNHDFHVSRLMKYVRKKYNLSSECFIHQKSSFEIDSKLGKLLFTHGDDIEIDNESYRAYKKKINNPFVKFLGDFIVPFSLIEWIGHRASDESRKENLARYELSNEGQSFIKDKFRKSAEIYLRDNQPVNGLICGHSHCKDLYQLEDNKFYINNGYAPKTQSFIYIDNSGPSFIDL